MGGIERLLEECKMKEVRTVLGVLSVMLESSEACRQVFVGIDLGFIRTLLDSQEIASGRVGTLIDLKEIVEERYLIVGVLYGLLKSVTWNCSVFERRL